MSLSLFLNNYRISKDKIATHCGLDKNLGSYNIPDNKYDELYKNIAKCIENNEKIDLTEINLQSSPIKIDIDIKYSSDKKRRITYDFITNFIKLYNKNIKKYTNIKNLNRLKAYVFLRDEPYESKINKNDNEIVIKDGIHIIYPHLVCDYNLQELIRLDVVKEASDLFKTIPDIIPESASKIIDHKVIYNTGWLMYGGSKTHICEPYKLKYVLTEREYVKKRDKRKDRKKGMSSYENEEGEGGEEKSEDEGEGKEDDEGEGDEGEGDEGEGDEGEGKEGNEGEEEEEEETETIIECEQNELSNYELVKLLSIRNKSENTFVNKIFENELMNHKLSKIKKKTNKIERNDKNEKKIVDIDNHENYFNREEIERLITMLSVERATNYTTWINVGFCLFNISENLLDLWIDFSSKAPNFDEESCIKKWKSMKKGTLKLGTLHMWAKQDSPNDYNDCKEKSIRTYIDKSISGTTTDIAQVIYEMYKYKFRYCSGKKSGTWFEFKNHRWFETNEAMGLLKLFHTEVMSKYLEYINYITDLVSKNVLNNLNVNNDNEMAKIKPLVEITFKLRDTTFKHKLLSECKMLFNDQDFRSKLNTNIYLLGFENGVYDLKHGFFRAGTPEDYISMSCKINYHTFENDHEYIVGIFDFFDQLFTDKTLRNFMFIKISSMLEGMNACEKFDIWTGVGGNGKSKLIQLLEYSLGDYIKRVPTTLFTQKSRSSGSATPETERLDGARIITSNETNKNDKFNISLVKELTGNDTIYVRGLFEGGREIMPQFSIIFCCNHKPTGLDSDDDAIWRRMCVAEFSSRFVENPDPNNKFEFKRDNYLVTKLKLWKEAFVFLLLEFYKDYKKNGLVEPQCVIDTIIDYQKSSDSVSDFIAEKIIFETNGTCKLIELHKEFQKWWVDTGYKANECPKRTEIKSLFEKKWGNYANGWSGRRIKYDDEEIVAIKEGFI